MIDWLEAHRSWFVWGGSIVIIVSVLAAAQRYVDNSLQVPPPAPAIYSTITFNPKTQAPARISPATRAGLGPVYTPRGVQAVPKPFSRFSRGAPGTPTAAAATVQAPASPTPAPAAPGMEPGSLSTSPTQASPAPSTVPPATSPVPSTDPPSTIASDTPSPTPAPGTPS